MLYFNTPSKRIPAQNILYINPEDNGFINFNEGKFDFIT